MIALVRDAIPGALIGATVNPYAPLPRALANLLPKLRAGARFVQTSPILDPDALRPIAERVRAGAPGAKLVPIVMPVVSLATAERLRRRLDLPIPPDLIARLEAGGVTAGWAHFAETVTALFARRLADGVAVMTPEMDAPAHFAGRIGAALGALPRP